MADAIRRARDAVILHYRAASPDKIKLGQYFIGWCNYLVWTFEEETPDPAGLLDYDLYSRSVAAAIMPFLRLHTPADADPVFAALARVFDG